MDATDVNPWGKQVQPSKKLVSYTSSGKFSKKVSQKFHKTKVAAASGAKKIKAGASAGVNWLKIKYHAHKLSKRNKSV
ncbi:hypothetical protein Lser_V15G11474 [Lactuca serriola]